MTVDLQPGSHHERTQRPTTPKHPLSKTNRQLVQNLYKTLQALEEAGDPLRSSEIGGQTRMTLDGSEADEGAATRWARNMERQFHRRVGDLLSEVEAKLAGAWKPSPPREKVRCVRKSCSVYGKRIPRFMGPADQIENTVCQVCGNKLTQA